jgi:hypothetical protein
MGFGIVPEFAEGLESPLLIAPTRRQLTTDN